MSSEDRAARLKRWALESGFDRAGVATVEPSSHARALRRWIEQERHAGMGYMARRVETRLDPRKILPEAKTALCVALRYGDGEETEGDLWPRVARYARGEDYHDVMGRRLRELAERIESFFPGTVCRPYVDTGPVLERELGARAGLGAVGKNTSLLHPEEGSWFLLGEILSSLDLEPDAPFADLCGSCTACLDACPTGALPAPFELDSRLCISYWTIEHRGAIPSEVRGLLGDWVFGCDVCQEVCPWNRESRPASSQAFALPEKRRRLGLVELLGLERDEYVERFRGSPMKRAKLEGLKRNAAVAMGNRGRREYVPALAAALEQDEDPIVRGHAAWSLGRIGGVGARKALESAWASETDSAVRQEIRAALEPLGAPARLTPP